MKASINQKNNSIIFSVDAKIYSKDVIYKACYVFIDRMYIFLNTSGKRDTIEVTLKGKSTLSKKNIEKLEGEFMNELLNCLVRENVSKRNQKVLEQIVGGAMGSALGINDIAGDEYRQDNENEERIGEDMEIERAVENLRKELEAIEAEDDYEGDMLGIRNIISVSEVTDNKKKTPAKSLARKNKQAKKKSNAKRK